MSILCVVIWAVALAILWGASAYLAATLSENPRRRKGDDNERN